MKEGVNQIIVHYLLLTRQTTAYAKWLIPTYLSEYEYGGYYYYYTTIILLLDYYYTTTAVGGCCFHVESLFLPNYSSMPVHPVCLSILLILEIYKVQMMYHTYVCGDKR